MSDCIKPCGTCPFSRSVRPGALGGGSIPQFIGQVCGPFFLPCHSQPNYGEIRSQMKSGAGGFEEARQCAGAAVFRANIGRPGTGANSMELTLPPDREKVFSSYAEFVAHHGGITVEQSALLMRTVTPEQWRDVELRKLKREGSVRYIPRKDAVPA